jgi:intraflagellar transport protein 122
MESPVRYIKVVGGPNGKEGILVGLKTGHVFQIFVDSPFPVLLVKLASAIRCLDLNSKRTKLAAIDENQTLYVYNIMTGDLLYQEPRASSVAWNLYFENMLAFSGDGSLTVMASNFQTHKQPLQVIKNINNFLIKLA